MNSTDLQTFNQAVSFANSGQKQQAHELLKPLLSANSSDTNLLLWLAFTSPDLSFATIMVDKVVALDPTGPGSQQAKNWLEQERLKQQQIPPGQPPLPNFQTQTFSIQPPPPQQNYNQQPQPQPQVIYVQQPIYMQQPSTGYGVQPSNIKVGRVPGGIALGFYLLYFIFCAALAIGIAALTPLFAIVVILLTSGIAAYDSSERRKQYGPDATDSPIGVFLACIFLWVLILPGYLVQRQRPIWVNGQLESGITKGSPAGKWLVIGFAVLIAAFLAIRIYNGLKQGS